MDCPACGSVASINAANVCSECWHKLPSPTSAVTPTASTTAEPEKVETCPACWKKNQAGQQFCKHCGSEMHAAELVVKQPAPKPVQPDTQAAPPPAPTHQEPARPVTQQDLPPTSAISLVKTEPAKIEPPVEAKPAQPARTPNQPQDAAPSQLVNAKKTVLQIIGTVLRIQKAQHQLGILIMGAVLLLGAGGAYYLWQKYSAVLTKQEPVAAQETVEPRAATRPNSQQEPALQNDPESVPQPQVAEATVEHPAKPDPIPAPSAAPQSERTYQGDQPSTKPRNTGVSKPAPIKESGLSQAPTDTGGTQEKPSQKPAPKVESKPGTVEEIVAQKCVQEKGFKRVICEEKVRFKLCDGQWGVKLGCPKYEHDDPFKF